MDEETLGVEDAALLREMISSMKDEQVWRTLEDLAKRELELLKDERVGTDPDLRQATLWNAAAMIAAAETFVTQVREDRPISPDRRESTEERTSADQPGVRPPPE